MLEQSDVGASAVLSPRQIDPCSVLSCWEAQVRAGHSGSDKSKKVASLGNFLQLTPHFFVQSFHPFRNFCAQRIKRKTCPSSEDERLHFQSWLRYQRSLGFWFTSSTPSWRQRGGFHRKPFQLTRPQRVIFTPLKTREEKTGVFLTGSSCKHLYFCGLFRQVGNLSLRGPNDSWARGGI